MGEVSQHAMTARAREARHGIFMLAAGETLVWAGLFYSFAALLYTWESTLGWSKSDLTLAFTLAVLASALSVPISGRLIDRNLGKYLLGTGAVLGALALVALSQVHSLPAFLMIWIIIGICQGACLYEPCFAFVTHIRGTTARSAITTITLAAGFASPIAFPAGAALASMLGWRGAVLGFAAGVALVAAPLLYRGAVLLERSSGPSAPVLAKNDSKGSLRRAVSNPAFWLMSIAFPLLAMEHGILISHIIPLLIERGFEQATAVLAASVFGPMQVAGRAGMMLFGARARTQVMIVMSFTGAALAAVILVLAGLNLGLVLLFASLQGASFGLISMLKPAVIAETLGRRGYGVISGLLAVPYLIGSAAGPWIGAILWGVGGYDLALWAAIAMALSGLAAMVGVLRLAKDA